MKASHLKFAVLVLGLIVLLEIVLRLSGSIYLRMQNAGGDLGQTDSLRILCIGESTTALGGEHSYPAQLGAILNSGSESRRFQVINKGIPGVTTTDILDQLSGNLETYDPHIVIAMLGINDDIEEDDEAGFISLMTKRMAEWRVAKVVRYLIQRISGYEPRQVLVRRGWGEIAASNYAKAEEIFIKNLKRDPEDIEAYINLSLAYAFAGEYDRAESTILDALQKEPRNIDLHIELGQIHILQRDWMAAQEILEKARRIEPDNDDVLLSLGWCFLKRGQNDQSEKMLREYSNKHPGHDSYAAMEWFYRHQNRDELAREYADKKRQALNQMYPEHTRQNIQRLKETVMSQRRVLILVQYPRRPLHVLKAVAGEASGLIYVDNEALFNHVVREDGYDKYFINNFAGDFGHATPAGNRLLAENIAVAIRRLIQP